MLLGRRMTRMSRLGSGALKGDGSILAWFWASWGMGVGLFSLGLVWRCVCVDSAYRVHWLSFGSRFSRGGPMF